MHWVHYAIIYFSHQEWYVHLNSCLAMFMICSQSMAILKKMLWPRLWSGILFIPIRTLDRRLAVTQWLMHKSVDGEVLVLSPGLSTTFLWLFTLTWPFVSKDYGIGGFGVIGKFNPQAFDFSLPYCCWIKLKGLANKGNDHQRKKLLVF